MFASAVKLWNGSFMGSSSFCGPDAAVVVAAGAGAWAGAEAAVPLVLAPPANVS